MAIIALLVEAPLFGWPGTLRLSVVLGAGVLIGTVIAHPWRWQEHEWRRVVEYDPSRLAIVSGAVAAGILLFWTVLTLFEGGHINGVDFTIYFDRPLYQTLHGRPLYVETTDDPLFAHRTHLGEHAYWLLLPLSLLYAVHATPLWLLAISVIAVVAGSVHIVRIGRQVGFGGVLSCAAALVFLLNDNTARALRYGFHPEVLYAWFVPWLIDAGLRGAKSSYLVAAIACVLVKEDACLPLVAAVVTLGIARTRHMSWTDRVFYFVIPPALALANLAMFYRHVVPALSPTGTVEYAKFWANYGATPIRALLGMLKQPLAVARDVATSGLLSIVLPPFLFLPIIGWRWSVGVLPIVVLWGASANDQLRGYGIYYAIYLVPFLSLAAASGALTLMRWIVPESRAVPAAAALIVLAALVIGRGYALRPWRAEIGAVPDALELLAGERTVLVQSGLYPHAGYSPRVQLLTPRAMRDPANADAAILVAPGIGDYPLRRGHINWLSHQPPIGEMPGAVVAVRNPPGGRLGEMSDPMTAPGHHNKTRRHRRDRGR